MQTLNCKLIRNLTELTDTNGAGDAFTGGFLAMYIHNKTLEQCIDCAIYCATECVKLQGQFTSLLNCKTK